MYFMAVDSSKPEKREEEGEKRKRIDTYIIHANTLSKQRNKSWT